jgi:serine/threonine-protein kinase HipA
MVDRGAHTFRYEQSWLESEHRRSLSLSIPISGSLESKGDAVKNFFDNLLPDNDRIRARLGRRFNVDASSTFDLLQAIGRDCVGAIQLLPDSATPDGWDRIECDPMSEEQLADLLRTVPSEGMFNLPDDDLFRISIAGAQEKTALTRWNNQWCRPHGSTPTTHIFKLPLGIVGGMRFDASDSVQNEWLCAQIIRELGLPVANTSIEKFGDQTVLCVERFDREWSQDKTWIQRLPQEDFCQALGFPPDKKYERDGGPGMLKCLQLLAGSSDQTDKTLFILTQFAFGLLAATDGHAKNFSIFLDRDDKYGMTPLYDILSMWPYIGEAPNKLSWRKAGLAMAVRSKNAHYHLYDIQTRHWHKLAMRNGGQDMWNMMVELAARVDSALKAVESLLPHDFPQSTWTAISAGMRREATRHLSTATRNSAVA